MRIEDYCREPLTRSQKVRIVVTDMLLSAVVIEWTILVAKVTALVTLALLAGCATLKPKPKPVVFVLHNCQTIEQVQVVIGKKQHEELACECSNRSEKIDAKTNRLVIECQ